MKTTILHLIALIGIISFTNAQNPQWLNYTTGDIICSLAAESNDMWAGTTGGQVQLDKTTGSVTFYNTYSSDLPDNAIRSVTIDGKETKWIGAEYGGLAAFNENGIPVSVNEKIKPAKNHINIFPNPAETRVTISAKEEDIKKGINIYNQTGQIVIHKKGNTNTVDVSGLNQGICIAETETENEKYRRTLMIE